MKLIPILLFTIFTVVMATFTVSARPQFVVMDTANPKCNPPLFGYHVLATRSGDTVQFTVDLNQAASKALQSFSIFFRTSAPHPEITVQIQKTSDHQKRLSFTIPEKLLPSCVLQLQSAPIRPEDNVQDFYAYRLRIDNALPAS